MTVDALVDRGSVDPVEAALRARIADLEQRLRECDELLGRGHAGPMVFGGLIVDRLARRVTVDGRRIAPLPREYAVLVALAAGGGAVVSHERLRQAVWGASFERNTNGLAVHVSRLRRRLAESSVRIETERGRGYRLASSRDPDPGCALVEEDA